MQTTTDAQRDATERPGRIGSETAKARRPRRAASLFDPKITRRAVVDSFKKLDPRVQAQEPGDVRRRDRQRHHHHRVRALAVRCQSLAGDRGFIFGVAVWLWFTVLFANFAEAMAEGRGKAQADTLRRARSETLAKRLRQTSNGAKRHRRRAPIEEVAAPQLRKGDLVLVEAGDLIPGDGEVIEGVASVDESAITGESAPVIRESGGDRSAVTGGTRVLSDWIVVRITSNPGETFLDRMIALVEGASRQKTPNEIALNILLAVLTLIFLLAVVTLEPFAHLLRQRRLDHRADRPAGLPDPDDHRRAALGHRHRRHGPAGAAQRAGDERARRRGGGRRGCAAAGQDRHDHAGQPHGDASSSRSPA